MKIEFISNIGEIEFEAWQGLWQTSYPFVQYEFLRSLERSGCVSDASGWQPQYLVVFNGEQLVAAMPLYIKTHSYGEYVFDWAWADAYERNGLNYYPKLLNAIPFTPATGPRFAIAAGLDEAEVLSSMGAATRARAGAIGASSWHCLFPNKAQQQLLENSDLMYRRACQFHWHNRGYQNFDDFLQGFNSRKRKNLKKERRKIGDAELVIKRVEGAAVSPQQWQDFYLFYHLTYLKRSGRQGYLNQEFFQLLADNCADSIMMVQAYTGEKMVAAALYFKDEKTLYGRYWGCQEEFDGLHFEACYYQGIEYAIAQGLQKFDPGAQGEHKIQRGFEPVQLASYHWIAEPQFAHAIGDFLQQEAEHTQAYHTECQQLLPFKTE